MWAWTIQNNIRGGYSIVDKCATVDPLYQLLCTWYCWCIH
jgi:hypothetical protein